MGALKLAPVRSTLLIGQKVHDALREVIADDPKPWHVDLLLVTVKNMPNILQAWTLTKDPVKFEQQYKDLLKKHNAILEKQWVDQETFLESLKPKDTTIPKP